MKKVKQIPQLIQTECGLCCIAMISRYYKSYITLNDLREYLDPGRDGVDIRSMYKLLLELNYDSQVFKVKEANGIKALQLPCILYWKNNHFVVLERITKKGFIIVDPALGRLNLNETEFNDKFSNIAIIAKPNENFKKIKKRQSIWLSYMNIILKSKKLLFLMMFLSIINYIFTLMLPIITQKVIDNTKSINKQFALGLSIVFFTYIITIFLNGKTQVIFKMKLFKNFSEYVYKHLISVPYNFFEKRSYGSLLFSLESLTLVRNLYAEKLVSFFINLGAVIILIIYLFLNIPILGITLSLILILVAFLLKLLTNRILMLNQIEISGLSNIQAIQTELIYSMLNIKIAKIENKIYDSWNKEFLYTLNKTKDRDLAQNYYTTVSTSIQTILPIILLILGIGLYSKGLYSLGQIISYYSIINTVCIYSVSLITTMNYFKLSEQYLERVKDITDQEIENNGKKCIGKDFNENIKLENISFRYNKNSETVLKNINMNIPFGKKVAIVGASGSGKSTLGKLILGLYEISEGFIKFGNIDLKDIDKRSLSKLMGIVPQDTYLFNKTIFDNITMNRNDITLEQVKEACVIAQIDKEIESMPMGYNTLISDMGMNISGGQRQRIILARSIVSKPKIILFDEATSSLDSINENNISKYLENLGCTRIIIAHRLSTIVDADIIYVLQNGEIIEQGNHDELIRKKGVYFDLYNSNDKKSFV
ncbi:ABC transporter [Clostridium perfringens]|uniref:peptidase domain-containing ABC transporter n=1 Tax=Clostridium perfringens TaxID=1502 RepID=UPI000D710D20|nr:peptidase domain-containing ABC transporter [Clostridium perfringens]PWX39057.1 ABC transporter [Clostridium perfringens]PWX56928.1 ABC transporter [Clostridium perfringens]